MGVRSTKKPRWRLSGWQRLGLLLTLVWILTCPWWGKNIYPNEIDFANTKLTDCIFILHRPSNDCFEQHYKDMNHAESEHRKAVLFCLFGSIALGWIGGYAVFGVGKWIRRGFEADKATEA